MSDPINGCDGGERADKYHQALTTVFAALKAFRELPGGLSCQVLPADRVALVAAFHRALDARSGSDHG